MKVTRVEEAHQTGGEESKQKTEGAFRSEWVPLSDAAAGAHMTNTQNWSLVTNEKN